MKSLFLSFLLMFTCSEGFSQNLLKTVKTRDTDISYWWQPATQARATVVLFSGGSGGMGYKQGVPMSNNFLVRTRDDFSASGFNVAIVGNPADKRQLDDTWRMSKAHLQDTQAILQDIQAVSNKPIWLVGTSRGTLSAAAQAIELGSDIAGLVLTASLSMPKFANALQYLPLQKLTVPVLIYHQEDDQCRLTLAQDTLHIFNALTAARVKKRWIVSGGQGAQGDPCEALHWHGFIGMEKKAVADIAQWIGSPKP